MRKFGERSKKNMIGLHPNLIKVLNEAIIDSPVDFTITEGLRTDSRQKQLYSYGRTIVNPDTGPLPNKPLGMIVTNRDGVTKKSEHQPKVDGYGYAVDIYPYYNGKVQIHDKGVIPALKKITDHIKATAKKLNINISCGIDWKNPYDPPHIELR